MRHIPSVGEILSKYPDGAKLSAIDEALIEKNRAMSQARSSMEWQGLVSGVDDEHAFNNLKRNLDTQEVLEDELEGRAERRDWECRLADYIDEVAAQFFDVRLERLARSMRDCRQTGTVGQREDGSHTFMWDHKCGQVRLCPDEARTEQQRVVNKYQPLLEWFKQKKPTHRLFYCVLSLPNERPGQLRNMKHRIFQYFKTWTKRLGDDHGMKIHGSLVTQEDPLSAHDDWNVHLNVILCVEGPFSYEDARAAWGFNVHFDEIDGKTQSVRSALMELIKYSAKPVGGDVFQERDPDAAPGMTDWPPGRWYEWWRAQQGFRRTRAYGCLYAPHRKRWDNSNWHQHEAWWNIVRTICDESPGMSVEEAGDRSVCASEWNDLSERQKGLFRRAMDEGMPEDHGTTYWVGRVSFERLGARYRVDLITENNFSGLGSAKDNFSRAGPPPYPQ